MTGHLKAVEDRVQATATIGDKLLKGGVSGSPAQATVRGKLFWVLQP
jgi:hypothetical protein